MSVLSIYGTIGFAVGYLTHWLAVRKQRERILVEIRELRRLLTGVRAER